MSVELPGIIWYMLEEFEKSDKPFSLPIIEVSGSPLDLSEAEKYLRDKGWEKDPETKRWTKVLH